MPARADRVVVGGGCGGPGGTAGPIYSRGEGAGMARLIAGARSRRRKRGAMNEWTTGGEVGEDGGLGGAISAVGSAGHGERTAVECGLWYVERYSERLKKKVLPHQEQKG